MFDEAGFSVFPVFFVEVYRGSRWAVFLVEVFFCFFLVQDDPFTRSSRELKFEVLFSFRMLSFA